MEPSAHGWLRLQGIVSGASCPVCRPVKWVPCQSPDLLCLCRHLGSGRGQTMCPSVSVLFWQPQVPQGLIVGWRLQAAVTSDGGRVKEISLLGSFCCASSLSGGQRQVVHSSI